MIRGTTAEFKFEIPSNITPYSIEAVFWQPSNSGFTPISKNVLLSDVSNNQVIVALLPSETVNFSSDVKGYAQIKITCAGDNCYATYPKRFTVYPIHASLID